jgi:hypothetical protein
MNREIGRMRSGEFWAVDERIMIISVEQDEERRE